MSQFYQAAIQAYETGQFAMAASQMAQHLKTDQQNAEAWHLLGIMHYQNQAYAQACIAIEKATQLQTNNTDFLNNFGLVLKANGQIQSAIKAYQQALQLAPKDKDIQLNLANSLMETARYEEAAGLYRRLIHQSIHQPKQTELIEALCYALTKLGNAAHQAGKFKMAEACFAEAVALKPNASHLLYNLANAERELGLSKQAALHYQQTIQLTPDNADAYNNLGNVQRELGQLAQAIASYQKALALNPALHHAAVHLAHQKQHACDWEGLDEQIHQIREWVKHEPNAQISPFALLAMPGTTAAEQLQCANQWLNNRYAHLFEQADHLSFDRPIHQKKRLKIGYLSADFRLHPLAFLITDLIECHDRDQFEIVAYAFGKTDNTPTSKRLKRAFDALHDINHFSETEAAQKIYADEIDILVDLTGFTHTSRSGIAALRPAQIQISWLGFPGTMGKFDICNNNQNTTQALFDYLLTDKVISPPESAANYAEQFAYLSCYQPNDRKRPIGKVPSRMACGLPADGFVFCAFNQSFKITAAIFASWMRILKACDRSVLWLLDCHPLAKNNLQQAAIAQGIDPERLVFAPRVEIATHLARHAHADLLLDTPSYNAHTTCSDALWMDVPVLSKIGATFASRVAASLLSNLGLTELIVDNEADYESKAIALYEQQNTLASLKKRLHAQKQTASMFDTPSFARELESIYQDVWHKKLTQQQT